MTAHAPAAYVNYMRKTDADVGARTLFDSLTHAFIENGSTMGKNDSSGMWWDQITTIIEGCEIASIGEYTTEAIAIQSVVPRVLVGRRVQKTDAWTNLVFMISRCCIQ
jgi:hypothetical protein